MNGWIVGAGLIVYAILVFWAWAIVRVGAKADQQIEEWLRENDEGA